MRYIDPQQKILAHLDRLHQIKQGHNPPPINVEIDLSNRCSLGCAWCHFAYTHTRGPLAGKVPVPAGRLPGGDLMDTALAYDILDQLVMADVQSVTWTGGGEPTLHPDFDAIIRYAHEEAGIDQGLYTHGGHIDAARAALLKRALTWVYVSLDECTPQAYQRSKGVDRFEAACEGVRQLVAARGDATVGVGFLLHARNAGYIKEMRWLGRKLGADYVQFRPTVEYDQAAPSVLPADADLSWIDEPMGVLWEYEGSPGYEVDTTRFYQYQHWTGHPYTTCYWSAVQTTITPNGRVWRCVNKREHAGALLGDLTLDSFANIWNRAGGPCAVDGDCRIMCRGHFGNVTLNEIMVDPPHRNFV